MKKNILVYTGAFAFSLAIIVGSVVVPAFFYSSKDFIQKREGQSTAISFVDAAGEGFIASACSSSYGIGACERTGPDTRQTWVEPNWNWTGGISCSSAYIVWGDGLRWDPLPCNGSKRRYFAVGGNRYQVIYSVVWKTPKGEHGNTYTATIPGCVVPDLTTQHRSIDFLIGGSNQGQPSEVPEGTVVKFRSSVHNRGTGSTLVGSTARFCIDNSSCLTSGAGSLGNRSIPVLHGVGGTSALQTSNNWVATGVGGHTIWWCADVNDDIDEFTAANNCQNVPFQVVAASKPDLTTESIKVYDASNSTEITEDLVQGTTYTFRGIVRNIGDAATGGGFNNEFQRRPNGSGVWNWDNFGGLLSNGSLTEAGGANDKRTNSAQFTPMFTGSLEVRLCADLPLPNGVISESAEGEASNCAGIGTFTVVPPPSEPDLRISAFDIFDGSPKQASGATVTIVNDGAVDVAADSYTIGININGTTISEGSGADIEILGPAVSVGSDSTKEFTVTLPDVPGEYQAVAYVDYDGDDSGGPNGDIEESTETNNQSLIDTYETRSNLTIVPGSFLVNGGRVGEQAAAQVTIENNGPGITADALGDVVSLFHIVVDNDKSTSPAIDPSTETLSTDPLFAGGTTSGFLNGGGDQITLFFDVTLPGDAGTYTAEAMVDSHLDVFEKDENDNRADSPSYTVTALDEDSCGECCDGVDNDGDGRVDDEPGNEDFGCFDRDPITEEPTIFNPNDLDEFSPPARLTLEASPNKVQPNESTVLTWTSENIIKGTCDVTGTNDDEWRLDNSPPGGKETSGIPQGGATFTLLCEDLERNDVGASIFISAGAEIIEN